MKKRQLPNPKYNIDTELLREYHDLVSDLLKNELVQSMKNYIQHGHTNCYDHSLYVSHISFLISKKLGLDFRSTARGALLHDFFLYDWHIKGNSEGLHGFSHSRVALRNAKSVFTINSTEEEIILKHMWPLTLSPPKKREAIVVMLADKYCSFTEIFKIQNKKHLYALQHLKI